MIINIDTVTKEQIENLVSNSVGESKTLEFKQELPGNSDKDKKEFFADVSSFANASGGTIIYGIKEQEGIACEVVPIEGSADTEKLRLEGSIRAGISPTMSVKIKEIAGWGEDNKGFVLIIQIPQSFLSPHMVTFKNYSRFFSRHSAGKYQLYVDELRSAFSANEVTAERLKSFRADRISKIISDETPVQLSSPHRYLLHLIPIGSFVNNQRLSVQDIKNQATKFSPFYSFGGNPRFNIEGVYTYHGEGENCDGYCQIFHNGTAEYVYSEERNDRFLLASIAYEKKIIERIEEGIEAYKELDLHPPYLVSFALLNCKEMKITVKHNTVRPLDRDMVLFLEVIIENETEDVSKALRPLFDSVWNAFGLAKCYNYTDDGEWTDNPKYRS